MRSHSHYITQHHILFTLTHSHTHSHTHSLTHPQMEQAQDATDKRKQMETEREITSELVEKYKVYTLWTNQFITGLVGTQVTPHLYSLFLSFSLSLSHTHTHTHTPDTG